MAGLKITDLDDFLTPSQACIIPVRGGKSAGPGNGETEIHIDADNTYYEVSMHPTTSAAAGPSHAVDVAGRQALQKAEISLNDCLACSGCITSTESMLITMQSHTEVLDFIRNDNDATRLPVLSIAPQTLASLSASYGAAYRRRALPLVTLLHRIRAFLAPRGWRVYDTTFARHLSLRETVQEFYERRAAHGKGKARDDGRASAALHPLQTGPTPGSSAAAGGSLPPPGPLPVLASACPGWVCYAEKAQADLLPHLSAARSSQAVMGALVKRHLAPQLGYADAAHVYHVTAMPCYDKKLEAARSDFYDAVSGTRDTDCVLTTGELDLLLAELGFEPYAEAGGAARQPHDVPWPEMIQHRGTSSGSYLHTLMAALAAAHPGPTRVTERALRASPDHVEYVLADAATGAILFKGAKVYGFRNLQNLVRRVARETGLSKGRTGAGRLSAAVAARRRKNRAGGGDVTPHSGTETPDSSEDGPDDHKLDFVEVMACPGGCVNGGGQMKPGVLVDEEGYARPLPDDGDDVPPATAVPAATGVAVADEGMRWSTKEWVARVEEVYWSGLPTPPPSPPPTAGSADVDGRDAHGNDCPAPADSSDDAERALERAADAAADAVVRAMCGDDARRRWDTLRTSFRRVEGDVLSQGGGLTHEQVVW